MIQAPIQDVIENLRAIESGQKIFSIIYLKDQKMALDGVRDGLYKAAVIIPHDFSKRVSIKKTPEIGLLLTILTAYLQRL